MIDGSVLATSTAAAPTLGSFIGGTRDGRRRRSRSAILRPDGSSPTSSEAGPDGVAAAVDRCRGGVRGLAQDPGP